MFRYQEFFILNWMDHDHDEADANTTTTFFQ